MQSGTAARPVCFVSIPFGKKVSPRTGVVIDFDQVYGSAIKPAVEAEGLLCLRADDELAGGLIDKPVFSRLIHSDILIADLTTSSPTVLYELGIRHASRSRATIPMIEMSERSHLPMELWASRVEVYNLADGLLSPRAAVDLANNLRARIRDALEGRAPVDSPLFQLLDDFPGLDLGKVERTPMLFLSYARPDGEKVTAVYNQLKGGGYSPWMDVKNLLPGERWELKLNQAIENSDFFIAFLSAQSVDRRGVLRKELRQALEKWKEMLDEDIYLIPARLEPCDLPNELAGFQVLDLFEADWWPRLEAALRSGSKRRGRN
jgi:TIR domain-containing protein